MQLGLSAVVNIDFESNTQETPDGDIVKYKMKSEKYYPGHLQGRFHPKLHRDLISM